jgi:hypothetical protein
LNVKPDTKGDCANQGLESNIDGRYSNVDKSWVGEVSRPKSTAKARSKRKVSGIMVLSAMPITVR